MRDMRTAFALVLVLCLGLVGCSRTGDRAGGQKGTASQGDSVSEAASSRGVAGGEAEGAASTEPSIVLDGIEYEWAVSPDRGLQVSLEFVNPGKDVGRAKGYAFVIAGSSKDPAVIGVYPWNAKVVDGTPESYAAGGRVLFWDEQKMTIFIPYKERAGCFDTMRVLVYDDEGGVILDETHELPITGEPTGRKRIQQTLVL
jgi:hypothetical protein